MKPLFLTLFLVFGGQNAFAQPPEPPPIEMREDGLAILREWTQMRADGLKEEVFAPLAAIARYQAFAREKGDQLPGVGIAIASVTAQLFAQNLDNRAEATKIYQDALQKFAANPGLPRLQKELEMLTNPIPPRIAPIWLKFWPTASDGIFRVTIASEAPKTP